MTTLTLLRKQQEYVGFRCEGHSGYAEEDEDIICASISSMTQFCICCAEQFKLPISYRVEEALLECVIHHSDETFSGLLTALHKAVLQLQEDFPEHICLEIMEV